MQRQRKSHDDRQPQPAVVVRIGDSTVSSIGIRPHGLLHDLAPADASALWWGCYKWRIDRHLLSC
jgi:hypothetical protein